MKNYVILVLVLIAALALGEFVMAFADWNKMQACAMSGRRGCAGPILPVR